MGWEKILKRGGVSKSDIRLVNYILRDGEFRTMERIMDEIYDLIEDNKKIGHSIAVRIEGRPASTKFGSRKKSMKGFMTLSTDYESRDSGNKNLVGSPIIEYRYIGE
jgi:hypothetical protein